jgi:X-linked retinitis pigmentosa GTPase regulator
MSERRRGGEEERRRGEEEERRRGGEDEERMRGGEEERRRGGDGGEEERRRGEGRGEIKRTEHSDKFLFPLPLPKNFCQIFHVRDALVPNRGLKSERALCVLPLFFI